MATPNDEDTVYTVQWQVGDGSWADAPPTTEPLTTPQEADEFIEELVNDWPSLYGNVAWRVREVTSRTHHTLEIGG